MRSIKTTVAAAAACATLALTASAATAQTVPPDRRTFVTFSGPVSIPGMTLPAGTYTFRIADSNTDRHIVQIFNREGTKLMTTLLAVPAQRLEPTGDPVITFKETRSDQPPAVHYWYYAGDLAGNELVYPKSQAQMIANASGEPVMAVESSSNSIEDWKSGSMSRVKPDNTTGNDANASAAPSSTTASSSASSVSTTTDTTTAQSSTAQPQTQPTTTSDQGSPSSTAPRPTTTSDQASQPSASQPSASQPSSQPTTSMDQTSRPSSAPTAAPSTTDTNQTVGTSGRTKGRLPKTASELPMVGLIGLLALGGAVVVRAARVA